MQTAKPQARHKNGSFSTSTSLKSMDLTRPNRLKPPSASDAHHGHVGVKEPPMPLPFADDPLCKLNLKETCNSIQGRGISVQRRGVVQQRRAEAPSTPLFSFSVANHSRKSCPSKWDDAEKWLMCHDSPANSLRRPSPEMSKQQQAEVFACTTIARSFHDVPPTDKFTDEVDPRYSKQGFADHRDVGTSRWHRPFSSPARHNTPTNRSGFLAMANADSTMEVCHLAKLQLGTRYASNWSSKEEEEEEEQSLRHLDTSNGFRRSALEDGEEKTKCCLRYQREEARIEAWVNLQKARAEAQSRKLEVRIQKMRSEQEDKLMKRMEALQRKAQEWRISAQEEHSEHRHSSQLLGRGCFPCNKP